MLRLLGFIVYGDEISYLGVLINEFNTRYLQDLLHHNNIKKYLISKNAETYDNIKNRPVPTMESTNEITVENAKRMLQVLLVKF